MKKEQFKQFDGTDKISTTPRQEGTYLYFTGKGDDTVNQVVGGGIPLIIDNSGNTNLTKSIEFSFIDDVFMKDGIIFWENAVLGDNVTLEIYLPANTYYKTPHSTGNFDFVDGQYVANATWTGEYLALPVDYTLQRFVNSVPIMGTNNVGTLLESADVDILSKELKFRAKLESPDRNQNLKIAFVMEMYRKSTV